MEPWRIDPRPGELIVRDEPRAFTFNGQRYRGRAGDTIASALAANGVRVLAQSRRLQHPRGVLTADHTDPNCALQVGEEPNVRATHRLLTEGTVALSQHVWPSLRFDLKALNQRLGRLVGAGGPVRPSTLTNALRPAYHRIVERFDIGGTVGAAPPHGAHRSVVRSVDVMVVGGGASGMAAATAAARSGASVLLVEADHHLGGRLLVGGQDDLDAAASLRRELLDAGVEVLCDAVATASTGDGTVLVAVSPVPGSEELHVVRANQVIAASGLLEVAYDCSGNDLPGVMTATAIRRLVELWAVKPGRRAVVLVGDAHGVAAAQALEVAGVEVVETADLRRSGAIVAAHGAPELEEVQLPGGRTVAADLLVTNAGWTVDSPLLTQVGLGVAMVAEANRPMVVSTGTASWAVGRLVGDGSVEQRVEHAMAVGIVAAKRASREADRRASLTPTVLELGVPGDTDEPEPIGLPVDAFPEVTASGTQGVVDFAEDVTIAELRDSSGNVRFASLASAARAPMHNERSRATAGGRVGADAVASAYSGVSVGALADAHRERLRRSPVPATAALRAASAPIAGWADHAHFGEPDAERRAAELGAAVRDDVGTGLFDLRGRDCTHLVGAALGARRLPDVGSIELLAPVVDGQSFGRVIVARPAVERLLVRTEAEDASAVEAAFAEWTQLRRRDWQVHVTPLGESLPALRVLGPRAAEAVARLCDGAVPSAGHLVELEGPVRGWMWSSPPGRRPWVELRVTAGHVAAVWESLVGNGVVPVGSAAAVAVRGPGLAATRGSRISPAGARLEPWPGAEWRAVIVHGIGAGPLRAAEGDAVVDAGGRVVGRLSDTPIPGAPSCPAWIDTSVRWQEDELTVLGDSAGWKVRVEKALEEVG